MESDKCQGVFGALHDARSALHASIRQGNDGLVEAGVNDVAILRANLPAHRPALARRGIQRDMKQTIFMESTFVSRCAPSHIHADEQDDEERGQRPPDYTPGIAVASAIGVNA